MRDAIMKVHGEPLRLKTIYRAFNEMYFTNVLPKDTKIQWGWFMGFHAGETSFKNPEAPVIRINRRLKRWTTFVLGTLLHEMVHIKRRYLQDHPDHGEGFDKDMLALAELGAFKEIW